MSGFMSLVLANRGRRAGLAAGEHGTEKARGFPDNRSVDENRRRRPGRRAFLAQLPESGPAQSSESAVAASMAASASRPFLSERRNAKGWRGFPGKRDNEHLSRNSVISWAFSALGRL
jgi:hypothetical protein